ncbi:MAG: hypothetical protein ACYS19_13965 [Planctomycetota bacterium]|jgi:hypothetical protein
MIKKLLSIFALPFLLFCFHIVLSLLDVYQRYHWPDIPMHVLGGVFIANSFRLALRYFQEKKLLSELNLLSTSVFLFALTSTVAVIWEFGEFSWDFFFDTSAQMSLEDTMADMFLGILGGSALIAFLSRHNIKEYLKRDRIPQ